MLKFSNVLVELYEAAENSSLVDFPIAIVRILEKHIPFDGGVLGTGGRSALQSNELIIDNGYVFNRNESILDEYALLSAEDFVTQRYVSGLNALLIVQTQTSTKHKNNQRSHGLAAITISCNSCCSAIQLVPT